MSRKKLKHRVTNEKQLYRWLLGKYEQRAEAVHCLLHQNQRREGPPPSELIHAIKQYQPSLNDPIMRLACSWEREPLFDAFLSFFLSLKAPQTRESMAQKIPYLVSFHGWSALMKVAMDPYENIHIRKSFFMGIASLIATEHLCLEQCRDILRKLKKEFHPHLRIMGIECLCKMKPSLHQEDELVGFLDDSNAWVIARALDVLSSLEDLQDKTRMRCLAFREHFHPLIRSTAHQINL